ncbi:ATP-binding protein [Caulobacter sp. UNC279MFTsu5.1]|uniref:sensor histidine kinase n=1 Tax=Caulobacter sp. UNC279MFTsu5.1 TaxID=1502775 RepID=UPI0008EB25F9|nr:ATP-binding protein [Caulobacter sp. UNC279MFTsu5.1]SFK19911.1 Signal transduction histidine kinase [Caulobacter sp. UNC279MFTsu5.1]
MTWLNPSSVTRGVRSLHWIVGATIVLVAVSVLGSVALMLFAARSLDRLESQDERELVQRTIQRDLQRTTRELTSATVWDDAAKAMGPPVDLAWADINTGAYYHQYFQHDLTFVIRDGRMIYGSLAGARVSADALGALPADAAPLIARVAAKAQAVHRANRFGLANSTTDAGLVRSGDEIYLVAAADVIAETAPLAAAQRETPPAVVVTARRISTAYTRGLRQDLGIEGLSLIAESRSSDTSIPLHDIRGQPIGALSWTAHDPGTSLLKAGAPWIVLVFVALLAAAVVLFLRVTDALHKLADSRRALIAAKEEAEAANVAKTQFLANMSHEIRTPLNGVLGMTQVMQADQLPDHQRSRLDLIHQSGQALLALLNDILDMARLESGRVRLRDEPFDLPVLVEATCALFSGAAANKGIALSFAVAPGCEGAWIGDPIRLRQVLGNLVANAVNFTHHGSVRVEVRASETGLRFEVRDTGVGIAPEHRPRLFKIFSQLDTSMTRAYEGSGLGLAISHDVVTLMGGVIGVDSTPGAGSTFHFEAPLRRARTERPSLRVVGR